MTYAGDNWIRGSAIWASQKAHTIAISSDASCNPSTYAPEQRSFEATEKHQNVSHSLSPQRSSSGVFALKEHDYIGLSSDSSSSIERTNLIAGLTPQGSVGKALQIESLETELRLGLGPPDESQAVRESALETMPSIVCCGVGYSGGVVPVLLDQNVVNATASKVCAPQASLERPSVIRVGASSLKCGSAPRIEASRVADNTNGFPQVIGNRVTGQEPLQSWNGEHSITEPGNVPTFAFLLSQRDLVSVGSEIPEQKLFHRQERQASEVHSQDVSHCMKEQTWSSQSLAAQRGCALDKPHSRDIIMNETQLPKGLKQQDASNHPGASSGQVVRSSHDHNRIPLPTTGLLSEDLTSCIERSPFDPLPSSSLKYWHSPIFRSLDALRGGAQPELEVEKVSSMVSASGFSAARHVGPVSKCTLPAKRGFLEAIGPMVESRPGHPTENRNVPLDLRGSGINPISCVEGETKLTSPFRHYSSSVLHPWNSLLHQLPGSWQKGLAAGNTRGTKALSGSNDSYMKSPLDKLSTMQATKLNEDAQHVTNLADDNGASSARAPVVGWPPVRTFRKNTLAVNSKPNSEDQDDDAAGPSDCPQTGQLEASTSYVKANMDGVPIGRKVDLKAYNSYEGLKLALQDMFQTFLKGHSGDPNSLVKECKQLNLLQGSEYVLTHEDADGDWMLAGDVPWDMFVSTVKRLRIMKACDAIGLGQRVSTKLKHLETT